jgi:LPS-assembly lipoprotein
MSWLPRSSIVSLILVLAACGFTPMYGSGSNNAVAELDRVEIALIRDQSGVYLRNLLIDNFYRDGYPSSPTHLLQITNMEEDETNLDITSSSEATRKQIRIDASLALIDRATGQTVLSRRIYALASYNVLGSQFTTRVSENDAREAALNDLARQIESQLVLYFKR